MSDELLVEAIENSGYYEFKDVNWDDLPSDKRTIVILANELVNLRPDLFLEKNAEIVFIICRLLENGEYLYELPKRSLSELLKKPPYDDSVICSYSLKDEKILKKLYKGTGVNWEQVK